MKKLLIFSLLTALRMVRNALASSESMYKLLFVPGGEAIRWKIGKWKAWRAFEKARRHAPAYRDFLKKHHFEDMALKGWDPVFDAVPPTDKESYIKKYSIEERCHGGALPSAGVVIDESSGTSGSPNNWVRGPEERAAIKQGLQFALHHLIGKKPIFVINAFALGPWATGMNVSMSIVDVAVLKSTGPDAQKIINTLNFFGPKYHYVIMGYPPFLKGLVDNSDIDWDKFNIMATYGGEGMSEGMRAYLGRYFSKVYGSYGASDLEINIGAENDYTIAIRQLLATNEKLRASLIRGHAGGTPMIFQYNPFDYYIETNKDGELIVTLCRTANTAPKIRYNIHDTGYVIRAGELKKALGDAGVNWHDLPEPRTDLPLLFHFGRADMAVAYYGCKITPDNIKEVVYAIDGLAKIIESFSLVIYEDDNVNKQLELALEVNDMEAAVLQDPVALAGLIFDRLKAVNQDYREASKMIPVGAAPKVKAYLRNTGPFAINDIRLKKHYIQDGRSGTANSSVSLS